MGGGLDAWGVPVTQWHRPGQLKATMGDFRPQNVDPAWLAGVKLNLNCTPATPLPSYPLAAAHPRRYDGFRWLGADTNHVGRGAQLGILIAAVVVLYLVVGVLAVLVILLYRQFGLVYLGSRQSQELAGPSVGERAPSGMTVSDPHAPGSTSRLEWLSPDPDRVTVLVLGGPACRICYHLLKHVDALVAENSDLIARFVFVDRRPPTSLPDPVSNLGGIGWEYWRSEDGAVHDAFDVTVSPFVYVMDSRGLVRAKGIASTPDSIMNLVRSAASNTGSPDQTRQSTEVV
jgi:hypothetical protein